MRFSTSVLLGLNLLFKSSQPANLMTSCSVLMCSGKILNICLQTKLCKSSQHQNMPVHAFIDVSPSLLIHHCTTQITKAKASKNSSMLYFTTESCPLRLQVCTVNIKLVLETSQLMLLMSQLKPQTESDKTQKL